LERVGGSTGVWSVHSELEQASLLIGEIYDAALDPSLWRPVLGRLCGFVRAGFAILITEDAVSERAHVHYTSHDEDEWLERYFSKYIRLNPTLVPAVLNVAAGDVVSVADFMPFKRFLRTAFYKEWVAPRYSDAIISILEKTATGMSVCTAVRSAAQGAADAGARRRMRALTPHVRRAIAIGRVIDLASVRALDLASALDHLASGFFLTDAKGRIVHANASGEALLNEAHVLRRARGLLAAVDVEADAALHDAICAAAAGDEAMGTKGLAMALASQDDIRYIANVLPLTSGARRQAGRAHGATAAVFVRKAGLDMPSALETIAQAYKLTARELSVLIGIVEVGGIPDVAAVLGLSDATVKTYLRTIFRKTATSRQADLVKLVAGLASASATALRA
jgi:DNA-binding NarL/FixJ family response regulator